MKDQLSFEDSESRIRLEAAWQRVLGRISSEVQEPIMARFIRPLVPVSFEENTVRLCAPGRFLQEWVRERFSGIIQSYLSDELGQSVQLEVLAKPREKSDNAPVKAVAYTPVQEPTNRFVPNERYQFSQFVVGQSNRLAVAGAKAVAKEPGRKYNPLFIYGSSGLGKTHLLHSIARELLSHNPTTSIVYMTAQQFAEEFINALQANKVENFRRQHRHVEVWLVDDIQFLAGKDKTQEEIFHTFNYLHSLGKQIVLTSDRPPKDIYQMDERLRSRFEAGLVADIQMPDTETRCAIIMKKAEMLEVELNHDLAMFLAESVPGNVRVLEGAITKLVTMASLEGTALNREFAEPIVEQYYQNSFSKPGFNQIVDLVSTQFNITVEEMKGPSRKAPVVHARHIAIFLTRRITGDSWKHIGSQFGDRDHTSIMHGYQKIDEQMHHDKELLGQVKSLLKSLNPH
ncbi:MAG: chromosomal replication initiator protein DnaA [Armatimonadetes bacterium]|nr:chromosomal replication initiator protein DnaA [Armatimonadota bacterium]MBS1702832.1 chromosomal replication initiator protein DnaA [Armatimonadota bacterium]MBS1727929.1 chromosomal replication initiator protein DnaA [Armatimonadota bacterium]